MKAKEENLDNLKTEYANLKAKEEQGELTDADRERLKELETKIPIAREEVMKQEIDDLHNAAHMIGPLSQTDKNKLNEYKDQLNVNTILIFYFVSTTEINLKEGVHEQIP